MFSRVKAYRSVVEALVDVDAQRDRMRVGGDRSSHGHVELRVCDHFSRNAWCIVEIGGCGLKNFVNRWTYKNFIANA